MLEYRVWDIQSKKWVEVPLISSHGDLFIWENGEYRNAGRENYAIMLCSQQLNSDKEKIFEGDILKIGDKEDRLYLVEFSYTEFTLRDVTSENPKYDDDVDHDYGLEHNELLSSIRLSRDIVTVGNRYTNENLILDS